MKFSPITTIISLLLLGVGLTYLASLDINLRILLIYIISCVDLSLLIVLLVKEYSGEDLDIDLKNKLRVKK